MLRVARATVTVPLIDVIRDLKSSVPLYETVGDEYFITAIMSAFYQEAITSYGSLLVEKGWLDYSRAYEAPNKT